MTKRRNLKKTINNVCGDLFAECIASSLYNGKPDNEHVNIILASIISIHNDYVRRISHPEPGMTAKCYYNHLRRDFDKSVDEVIDSICNIG
ncbi:MAG: hypothetical protein SOZ80_09480 [Prevotella sp.]|uniref:hypothetical protein n=1 Tax=Prevotella sp. TaxID=59823 RepID=UPI002A354763|nr:hypothetical protein [Prevotella sp.]MDD7318125.1 hypothetical protein [Prevotellaceae bacterium]MDY4020986.1 hypothetical protein [Prevotella sp.]